MNAPDTKKSLNEIFDRRGGRPSGVLLRWATTKGRFLAAVARFLDQKQEARAPRDYGFIKLEEAWLDLETAINRIEATLSDPKGNDPFPFGNFYPGPSIGRRRPNYSNNLTEWCEWWIEARANDPRGTATAPSEAAVAPGLPPFDSCDRAIDDWILGQTQQTTGRARHLGEFAMVVTDTRGKLDGVRWEGTTLVGSTRTERSADDLELQAVVETDQGRVVLSAVSPAPPSHDWTVPDDARAGEVYLVHRSGDLMGMTRVTPGARVRAEEELLSISDQAARDLANGENDRVEFKPFMEKGDDKWWEVAKSVVAFANTFGGRLYIGARNGGDPEGEKAFDRVMKDGGTEREKLYIGYVDELVRVRVKPVPPFRVSRASHLGQPLLVISVASGTDKPYSTAMDEVLVRKGATNRRPDPQTELRRLYDAATPSTELFGGPYGVAGIPGRW